MSEGESVHGVNWRWREEAVVATSCGWGFTPVCSGRLMVVYRRWQRVHPFLVQNCGWLYSFTFLK